MSREHFLALPRGELCPRCAFATIAEISDNPTFITFKVDHCKNEPFFGGNVVAGKACGNVHNAALRGSSLIRAEDTVSGVESSRIDQIVDNAAIDADSSDCLLGSTTRRLTFHSSNRILAWQSDTAFHRGGHLNHSLWVWPPFGDNGLCGKTSSCKRGGSVWELPFALQPGQNVPSSNQMGEKCADLAAAIRFALTPTGAKEG